MKKIAFENEIIVVDKNGNPQNYIDGEIASKVIIDKVRQIIPYLIYKGGIDQKLDACQIELRNIGAKDSLSEAQDEILNSFEILEKILNDEFGLQILQKTHVEKDFFPVHSAKFDRYEDIHNSLLKRGLDYRKATNIVGLHINFDTKLEEYFFINNEISDLLSSSDFTKLGININRKDLYKKVVDGINKSNGTNLETDNKKYDNFDEMQKDILDENGNPKFSYSFLRLKKIKNQEVGELRSFDAGFNHDDIISKTTKSYELVSDITRRFNGIIL